MIFKRLLSLSFFVLLLAQVGFGQGKTYSGTVASESTGETLPGTTVVIKGTTTGTATNVDGQFSIDAASGDVLVFAFIGMETQELILTDVINLTVSLKSGIEIDEVVVTALGISREKRALGYSVDEIGGDELQRSAENNIIQSLAGKSAGVQVTGSSGTPGASSKILIRGPSTFTGENQPLIVVDGVPIDNETTQSSPRDYPFNANLAGVQNSNRALDINPNDIETVTILKGPAAAALYGARAGNGAIIYTTKKGSRGKKGLGVRVSSAVELSEINKVPDFQSSYNSGVNGTTSAFANPGPDERFGTADDVSFGSSNSWGARITNEPTFDNIDNFYQTGVSFVNNVEITGGNEKTGFRVSIGDTRQGGVIPETDLGRTSVRISANSSLSDKVEVSGSATYIRTSSTMAQNGSNLSGVSLGLFRMPVTFDVRNYETSLGYNNSYFFVYDNPLYTVNNNPFTSNVDRFLGNFYASVDITENLKASYRLGVDAYVDQRQQLFALSSNNSDIRGAGQINENRLIGRQIYGDFILDYKKKFSDKITFQAQGGHNFFIDDFDDVFSRGRNLTIPNFYNLSNASDLYSSRYTENLRTFAFFGNVSLDYDRWLYVNVTGRNEWASSFELANNNFFYPSVSTSIVFSELLNLPDWIDFGKVRYSYAQVGIPPVPYQTRTYYVSPTYTDGFTNGLSFPYGDVNGFGISDGLGDPNLEPERLIGNEVGLNMSFLDNTFNLDVTYYHQKSTDILLFRPAAPTSGFDSQYTNAAEMVNQGWEITLGINPYKSGDFKWAVNMNWATNNNEVTALADGVEEVQLEAAFSSIGSFAIVGEPIGVFYGTRWVRNGNGDIIIGENGLPSIAPQSGNIGSWIPDWTAGIRNTFSYKDLTLSFFLDFRKGGDIWNGTKARMNNVGTSADSEDRERMYVVEGVDINGSPNTVAIDAQTYFKNVVGDAGGAAEEFVETVDWVRLRDLSLSYRLRFSETAKISFLDFTFTGRNLWLSTNYTGVDPETSLTGAGSNLNGFDYFNNPNTRSYRLAVSFSF
jgi:TonB-linked SusC/RagA family outer membrane protein